MQEYSSFPTGFPPPFDTEYKLGDSKIIAGKFIQTQSEEVMIAQAQGIKTRGRFVCGINAPISPSVTLRRVRDNKFISIAGDPLEAPSRAYIQIKTYPAEIIDRPMEFLTEI